MPNIPLKNLSDTEISKIISRLITVPGEIDDAEVYERFLTDLSGVITTYCGGLVANVSASGGNWFVSIAHDENVPDGAGIYAGYDRVNSWPTEQCENCLAGDAGCQQDAKGCPFQTLPLEEPDSCVGNAEDKVFVFSIDPETFKTQRTLLTRLLDEEVKCPFTDYEPLEGIRNLLDSIADQAHDKYGMDTLFSLEELEGECHVENN